MASENAKEPGLPAITVALEKDHSYHLVKVSPYDSYIADGVYAIWQRTKDAS